jgi:8-oxo-dGTP pyrophosphatase MutT (NUDIX family)
MSSEKPRPRRRRRGARGSPAKSDGGAGSGEGDPVGGAGEKAPSGRGASRDGAGGKSASGKSPGGKGRAGKAGSGKAGSGKTKSGKAGSGKAGSGKAGSGKAGSGKAGSGKAGSGKSGAGRAGRDRRGGGRTAARERSAGGVVVRDGEVVVIVPTRRASDGSKVVALPKGHIDPGESELEAATREVREETGIVAEPVTELGETRYWYRRGGQTIPKSVSFYLFRYMEGDTADHDDEVERAWWISLADAQRELSHAAEREMVARAAQHLEAERKER